MIIQAARIAMFGSPLFPTSTPQGGTRSPRGEKGQEQSPAKAGGFTDPLFETLNTLEYSSDALAAADAHADQAVSSTGPLQFIHGLDGQNCPGRADWVSQ